MQGSRQQTGQIYVCFFAMLFHPRIHGARGGNCLNTPRGFPCIGDIVGSGIARAGTRWTVLPSRGPCTTDRVGGSELDGYLLNKLNTKSTGLAQDT